MNNFKSHFISVLNGVDDSFPYYCWYILIAGVCMQLSIQRYNTMKPENSAHSFLFGTNDLNTVRLVPLGFKVIMHHSKFISWSWSDRGVKVFYIGPAHQNYLC